MQPVEIITIVAVCALVVGLTVGLIVKKHKDKKAGRTGCCDCSSCPYCSSCKKPASTENAGMDK